MRCVLSVITSVFACVLPINHLEGDVKSLSKYVSMLYFLPFNFAKRVLNLILNLIFKAPKKMELPILTDFTHKL